MTDLEGNEQKTPDTKKNGVLTLSLGRKISVSSSRLKSHGGTADKHNFSVVRKRGRVCANDAAKLIDDKSNLTSEESQARIQAVQKAVKLQKENIAITVKKEQEKEAHSRTVKEQENPDKVATLSQPLKKTEDTATLAAESQKTEDQSAKKKINVGKIDKESENASPHKESEDKQRGHKKSKLQNSKVQNSSKFDWKSAVELDAETTPVANKKTKYTHYSQRRVRTNSSRKNQDRSGRKIAKTATHSEDTTIIDLADQITEKTSNVLKFINQLGTKYSAEDKVDYNTAELIAHEFGHQIKKSQSSTIEDSFNEAFESQKKVSRRSPIVTIMGHVDHGKTSLLDLIRRSNITDSESGGITQHIGAYQTKTPDGHQITFIDTPGHAAFTSMRIRGANVTDIVILVVAADDGIMEQTVEAINHIKAASVPVIVAVNKMDKDDANVEKVINSLPSHNLVPEEYGGDVLVVPVSAKTNKNIEKLKDAILLQSEIVELECDPQGRACGAVLESKIVKNQGLFATLLVQNGTLKVGDFIVAGTACGRIRAMIDDQGKRIKEAPPSAPVEITGLNCTAEAGEKFASFTDEKLAKSLVEHRLNSQNKARLNNQDIYSFQDITNDVTEELEVLNLIIKADTHGSIEAISSSVVKLSSPEFNINISHSAIGAVSESDAILSHASQAKILAFNVGVDVNARALLKKHKIQVDSYSVIYDLLNDIESIVQGSLKVTQEPKYLGSATVRKVFDVSKVGKIAGCYVTDGIIKKNASIKLLRDGIVLHEGAIRTLRRFKENVKEVGLNFECGLALDRYGDIKEEDTIQAFEIIQS